MRINTLTDVLHHEIKDLYSAETQLIEALPKLAKKASHGSLKQAFNKHLEETHKHKENLEKVAKKLRIDPSGEKCKGMEGLIHEGAKFLQYEGNDALDAAIISAAQRIEHYEIAAYGCACTYAKMLGKDDVLLLLKDNMDDEVNADEKLTEIAEETVNADAQE